MSYRAFKRLLGETSLERKCRFLFGAFILLLITSSFWLYARQTESLAYDQLTTTCRLLVIQIVDQQLATGCRPLTAGGQTRRRGRKDRPNRPSTSSASDWGAACRATWQDYRFSKITPRHQAGADALRQLHGLQRLKDFLADDDKLEDKQLLLSDGPYLYYGGRPGQRILPRLPPRIATPHQPRPARNEGQGPHRPGQDRGAAEGHRRHRWTASTSTGPCSSPPPW